MATVNLLKQLFNKCAVSVAFHEYRDGAVALETQLNIWRDLQSIIADKNYFDKSLPVVDIDPVLPMILNTSAMAPRLRIHAKYPEVTSIVVCNEHLNGGTFYTSEFFVGSIDKLFVVTRNAFKQVGAPCMYTLRDYNTGCLLAVYGDDGYRVSTNSYELAAFKRPNRADLGYFIRGNGVEALSVQNQLSQICSGLRRHKRSV